MKTTNLREENSRYLEYKAFQWIMADDANDLTIAKRKLQKAMKEELTERQYMYCYDYYVRGWSMEAIGKTHGVNKSTVCRGINRAQKRLRRVLKYTSPAFL